MKNFHKKIIFLVLTLIPLFLAYFLIVPKLLHLQKYSQQIKAETEKSFRYPTKIGDVKTSLTWNLGVKVDVSKIDIRRKDASLLASSGPSSLEISLLALLRNKIKIRQIKFESLILSPQKLPNGKFDVEELFGKNQKIIFENTDISAKNYSFLLQNNLISPHQSYLIKGYMLKISDFRPQKSFSISTEGVIKKQNKSVAFMFMGEKNDSTFSIKNFKIKSQNINARLEGDIYHIGKKEPHLDLKLIIKNSQVKDIAHFFPADIKMPYDVFGNFKKINFNSTANANVDIQGAASNPDIFGYLDCEKFSFTRNHRTIPDGVVHVRFLGKSYHIDADILLKTNEHVFINGTISPHFNRISLGVKANNVELAQVQSLLFAIRDIVKFDLGYFVNNTIFEGTGSTNFYISGDSTKPFIDGYLRCFDCTVDYHGLSDPWRNVFGKVEFQKRNIYFRHIKTFVIKSIVFIDGEIDKDRLSLVFSSPRLNTKETRRLIYESQNLRATKEMIWDMKAISGYAKAKLRFGGTTNLMVFKEFVLDSQGGSVTYQEVGFPLGLTKGRVVITDKGTFFQDVQLKIFGIPAQLQGNLTAKGKVLIPHLNVKIKKFPAQKAPDFLVSPLIAKKQKQAFRKYKNLKGDFDADVTFLPNDCLADIKFHNTSALYAPLNLPLNIKGGGLKVYSTEIVFDSSEIQIGDFNAFFSGSIKDKIRIKNFLIAKNGKVLISANGGIEKSKNRIFDNFAIDIPQPMSVNDLNSILAFGAYKPFLKEGSFYGKMNLNGSISSPQSTGTFALQDIVPFQNTIINSGCLDLTPSAIALSSNDVSVGDTKIKVNLNTDKKLKFPLKINKASLEAPTLNVEKLMATIKCDNAAPFKFPFLVDEGTLRIKELVWGKLSASEFSSLFRITAEGVCLVPTFDFKTLDGRAKGVICYNPSNSNIKGEFEVKELDINTLASKFDSPDKFGGKVNGKTIFSSSGRSTEELIKNTQARADFSLSGGHSNDLGKIQYLLMAQNTAMAGVGNLNLNKILNLFSPNSLGDFKVKNGIIFAQSGSLMTQGLKVESENLDLILDGNFKMANKQASIEVAGNLPAAGKLGDIGNFSINSVISHIPAIGFVLGGPETEALVDSIPCLAKIPLVNGIGGEKSTQRYKNFVVRLFQDFKNSKSFTSFEWLDSFGKLDGVAFSRNGNTP